MAGKKGGFSKAEIKKMIEELKTQQANIQAAIKAMDNDINELQKGDGKTAYWSGSRATSWIKGILANLDNDEKKLNNLSEVIGGLSILRDKTKAD